MVVSREDIAGPLRELIASGQYAAGDKLPSVRDLAATYDALIGALLEHPWRARRRTEYARSGRLRGTIPVRARRRFVVQPFL